MYKTNRATSPREETDLVFGGWDGWHTPANATALADFSAVCFLTAKYLTDLMGRDKTKVIGLIESSWGGTRIESWSSRRALDRCSIPQSSLWMQSDPNENSVLWNAMVHPFLRHSIYGVLWYQGKGRGINKSTSRVSQKSLSSLRDHIP
jgi:hypothetical protein